MLPIWEPEAPLDVATRHTWGLAARRIATAHGEGRATVGELQVGPNSRNVVPGEVFFTVDLRHPDEKVLDQMEAQFREAKRIFTASQGATHVNTAIARLKLGRSLLRQKRYQEALDETKAGFDILVTQAEPSVSYLKAARTDLAAEYEALVALAVEGRPLTRTLKLVWAADAYLSPVARAFLAKLSVEYPALRPMVDMSSE